MRPDKEKTLMSTKSLAAAFLAAMFVALFGIMPAMAQVVICGGKPFITNVSIVDSLAAITTFSVDGYTCLKEGELSTFKIGALGETLHPSEAAAKAHFAALKTLARNVPPSALQAILESIGGNPTVRMALSTVLNSTIAGGDVASTYSTLARWHVRIVTTH